MDREAWHAAVHSVAESQTWLSKWTENTQVLLLFFYFFYDIQNWGGAGKGLIMFTHWIGGLLVTAANESYPDEQNCHLLEVDVICIF